MFGSLFSLFNSSNNINDNNIVSMDSLSDEARQVYMHYKDFFLYGGSVPVSDGIVDEVTKQYMDALEVLCHENIAKKKRVMVNYKKCYTVYEPYNPITTNGPISQNSPVYTSPSSKSERLRLVS